MTSETDPAAMMANKCKADGTSMQTEYNHQQQMAVLKDIDKQLNEQKANLIKSSIHAHTMYVDFTTQFSPQTLQSVYNAVESASNCKEAITSHGTKEDSSQF
ncbi:uncharacterized protein LOC106181990 [Lingula anatina]|uniref:Uncharacterized protein LOC106181990 n=1 Tax=Lingula anatina TaxID=7574 RepID=A0A1S3KHE2_LINAN|nr:uncharacterized protein LOC106181990 [Lingula anatina]XP_013422049.1 uncharacterized protein LOC106181990 [Lingula anatina]|eukprot:XP_013422048.1 uncharacterized protein LOC106181990 [Lingula anatina]